MSNYLDTLIACTKRRCEHFISCPMRYPHKLGHITLNYPDRGYQKMLDGLKYMARRPCPKEGYSELKIWGGISHETNRD